MRTIPGQSDSEQGWGAETRRAPWRETVGKVVTELGLYPVCRAIADVIAAHSDDNGKRAGHPEGGLKVATIAAECGYSVRHVHRGLRQLECAGVTGIERHPGEGVTRLPSHYHLAVRAWSLGAQLLEEWRQRTERKREAREDRKLGRGFTAKIEPEAWPLPSGAFVCWCGWEGVRGPCPVAHGPPGQ